MAIIAKAGTGSKFPPLESGVYTAVCYGIVDIGEQYSEKYDKLSRKVIILWELPGESVETENGPIKRTIKKIYTLSLNDRANLKNDLEAWRGKSFTPEELQGFELENILGKSCQIQIIKTEDGWSNVSGIMSLSKGMQPVSPTNAIIDYSLDDADALQRLSELPEWIQDRIKQSQTYQDMTGGFEPMAPPNEDDLPF